MPYYAHSVAGKPEKHWQPLAEHLRRTATLAQSRGEKFGASQAAFSAGLIHDLGKYSEDYQRRLRGGPKVDHSTAGARVILAEAGAGNGLVAELIAYAVAGHHAGLPTW